MFDKLAAIEQRYISMEDALMQPGIDGKELSRINKERAEIEDIVEVYRQYKLLKADEEGAKELISLGDSEMKDLAREELIQVELKLQAINSQLTMLMLPTDPRDHRNVMLEIRAGTGGDEAGLFTADLMRMYSRYADAQGWKIEILSASESTKGGYKEVVMMIEGKKVFSRLKFESGVHRVQRVPATEAQGRIHTSACTVAVLAEAEDVDIDINPSDLKIDTFRSSGAGGQHINTTDSAVRITHIPTGVVAECQEERSQHKNRDKAMKLLRTRMLEKVQQDQDAEIRADRKAQVGSGDRSERIRTYNFPQGRVTDHRINLTLYKLSEIMTGDIGDILDALGTYYTAELLKTQGLNG